MDWVLHSGRVFDGRRLHPTATAVAVRDGRVAAVGTDAEVRGAVGPAAEAIDLGGRLVTPGFTDAHLHAAQGGLERLGCDLSADDGASAALDHVARFAAEHPGRGPQGWIVGGGWAMADYPGGTPTRDLLDAVVPDRPVFLVNRDHHGAWVNSRALELAGLDRRTPDPADGRIERDADGEPAGTLHEGAMDLVARVLPPTTAAEERAGILEAQRHLHSLGVTGWHEAILGAYAGHADASPYYRELAGAGQLTGRVTGALWVPRTTTPASVEDLVESFRERRRINAGAGLATVTAKIMVDGVAENRTAAMLEPYCSCGGAGRGDDVGLTYLAPETLLALAPALDAAGFDLHLHAIGDRAVRLALDAVAAARAANGARGRHHIAHVQVVHPDDVPRFAAVDATVNAQALWACAEEQMTELTVPLLGPERTGQQYPFAALVGHGARLAMGSDWPVSSPDPWQAIHVAVTRQPPGEPDAEPFLPAQALDLTSALSAYTAGSAWLGRLDDGGTLEPGRLADLVVLDTDPFALPAADLHTVGAALTMVGGAVVHARTGALA